MIVWRQLVLVHLVHVINAIQGAPRGGELALHPPTYQGCPKHSKQVQQTPDVKVDTRPTATNECHHARTPRRSTAINLV